MMKKTHGHAGLLLALASPLFLSACDGAQWESEPIASAPPGGEVLEADDHVIANIELGNGNRYEIWIDQAPEGDEPGFVLQESGPEGNPSVVAVEELDSDNLSEVFHAIAPADMQMPEELLAAFGEPSAGKRGWLAERWRDPMDTTPAVSCSDTWWVNTVCNQAPGTSRDVWLNWGVTTTKTSWHWNTYNQNTYYVAVCNQGPGDVMLQVSYKDESSSPTKEYLRLAVPGTWYWWSRSLGSGIYNVHSYVYATSGTSAVDVCVARTPS